MVQNGLTLALRSTASGTRNKVLTLIDKLLKRIAAGTQAAMYQQRSKLCCRDPAGGLCACYCCH